MYQKWTISVCVCVVLQYSTISGFDKGVCLACISHEKVLPMQIEYMKLSMYTYGGWTKNRCMEVKLCVGVPSVTTN